MLAKTDRPPRRGAARWAAGYLALLAVLWAAEELVGERFWLTTLVTYAPANLFAFPLIPLLILAICRRDRRAVLLLAVSGWVLVFPLGSCAIGRRPGGRPREGITVMTYNIHGGLMGLDRVAAVVRSASPDIVCLQEARGVRAKLTRTVPGYHFASEGDLLVGSRYPIVSHRALDFAGPALWRKALDVRLTVHGHPLRVIAVHFVVGPQKPGEGLRLHWAQAGAARLGQVEAIVRWVQADPTRTIVAGDFNLPPRGLAYRRLTSVLDSGFSDAGLGFGATYPATRPLLRIDHVFTAHGPRATDAWVDLTGPSDHRALTCVFPAGADRQ